MRLCARRVSGAAHREQRCGLVVMDGWRPGAFRILAFWAGADEPQTREGGVSGVFGGGVHRFFCTDTNERIWAEGVTAPRVILLFLERSFEPPAQLMLAQPERGGRLYLFVITVVI